MTKQPLSVTEMFSSIMELLEQAGYAKHTLWGNMYGSLRSIVSFYHVSSPGCRERPFRSAGQKNRAGQERCSPAVAAL